MQPAGFPKACLAGCLQASWLLAKAAFHRLVKQSLVVALEAYPKPAISKPHAILVPLKGTQLAGLIVNIPNE